MYVVSQAYHTRHTQTTRDKVGKAACCFCFVSMFVDKQQNAHEKTFACSHSLLQRNTDIPHPQTEMVIHPSILFSLFSPGSVFSSFSSSPLAQTGSGLYTLSPICISSQSDGRRYCCGRVKDMIQHKRQLVMQVAHSGSYFDTEARYLMHDSPLKRVQSCQACTVVLLLLLHLWDE